MKRLALACALVLAISTTAEAAWVVARSAGPVWIGTSGGQKISLRSKEELQDGATITTGAGARVLLTRNKEVMTIGPNAVVSIPADNIFGFTTIALQAGQVEFDVEKRNVKHFAVETPFLAAVVKGTHFIVRVTRTGAKVSVSRGRVGVTDNASGQASDILPGQSASASRTSQGLVVTGQPSVGVEPGVGDLASLQPENDAESGADDDNAKDKNNKAGDSSASSGSGSGNGGTSGNGNGNGNSNSGSGNSNGNSSNGNGNGNGNSGKSKNK